MSHVPIVDIFHDFSYFPKNHERHTDYLQLTGTSLRPDVKGRLDADVELKWGIEEDIVRDGRQRY